MASTLSNEQKLSDCVLKVDIISGQHTLFASSDMCFYVLWNRSGIH